MPIMLFCYAQNEPHMKVTKHDRCVSHTSLNSVCYDDPSLTDTVPSVSCESAPSSESLTDKNESTLLKFETLFPFILKLCIMTSDTHTWLDSSDDQRELCYE